MLPNNKQMVYVSYGPTDQYFDRIKRRSDCLVNLHIPSSFKIREYTVLGYIKDVKWLFMIIQYVVVLKLSLRNNDYFQQPISSYLDTIEHLKAILKLWYIHYKFLWQHLKQKITVMVFYFTFLMGYVF